MEAAERRAQLQATEKEIDDLNRQVADADNSGDEKLAAGLRDRLNAAKRAFTQLQQLGDDEGDDGVSEEETAATAEGEGAGDGTGAEGEGVEETPAEGEGEGEGAGDGDEPDEAAGDEAASEGKGEKSDEK